MKFEITLDKLEEMVCCIVDCQLSPDDACEYATKFLMEINDIEDTTESDRQYHKNMTYVLFNKG